MEQRPRDSLTRCGKPSASSIVLFAPNRLTSPGSNGTSSSTTNVIPRRWEVQRSRPCTVVQDSAFLTHLAVNEHVAAPTQNQAFSALLFSYREVLKKDLDFPLDVIRAKKPKRLPIVLTREEVARVLVQLSGTHRLMAQLLYGSGLLLSAYGRGRQVQV
jgi:integrase